MRGRVRILAVALCALFLGAARWVGFRAPASSGHRQAAITFDDLPVISVIQLDAAARREITRKLLGAIIANKVPATGFVNEYGLYGFERDLDGRAPDPDGVSLLRM